jgi:hypothetical protein
METQVYREPTYRIIGADIPRIRASSLASLPTWLFGMGSEHNHIFDCSLRCGPRLKYSICNEPSDDPVKSQPVVQTSQLSPSPSLHEPLDDTDFLNWEELAYSDDEWANLAWEPDESWEDLTWEPEEAWDADDNYTFDTVAENQTLSSW